MRASWALCMVIAARAGVAQDHPGAAAPWRLDDALRAPPWLDATLEHRTRYEALDGQFRRGGDGSNQGLFFRSLLKVRAHAHGVEGLVELIDARQRLADEGSLLTTGEVDAVDVLQASAAVTFEDAFQPGATLSLRAGRMTLDVGSRRLVARNAFRNTINAFTGVLAEVTTEAELSIQGCFFLPLTRLPGDRQSLLDNDVVLDEEDPDLRFWGLVATRPRLAGRVDGQAFVLGLSEDDDGPRPTRNRDLVTLGVRLGPPPAPGQLDFEIESAVQVGEVRDTASPADTDDLDHLAFFQHAEAGYTFRGSTRARVAAGIDYASGDRTPSDDESNRFDPLFGARRFDFGPTGLLGTVARSNLASPFYRLDLAPSERWKFGFTHRFHYLADSSDAWTAAGIQDPTGSSGRFIGHQPEVSVRWDALPGDWQLEAGFSVLFTGRFADTAPGTTGEGNATYAYVQSTARF